MLVQGMDSLIKLRAKSDLGTCAPESSPKLPFEVACTDLSFGRVVVANLQSEDAILHLLDKSGNI
jgi:hypothetical protein